MNKKILLIISAFFLTGSQLWTSQLSQKEQELVQAVTGFEEQDVKRLLNEGVNPNIKIGSGDHAHSILSAAAGLGWTPIVKLLLDAGARTNFDMVNPNLPFHLHTPFLVADTALDHWKERLNQNPNSEEAAFYLQNYKDTIAVLRAHKAAQAAARRKG